jgi:transposase
VLVELNVVEHRLKAVLEVLDGATVVDVARRYLVGRQTVHESLRRDAADGLKGLVDPRAFHFNRARIQAFTKRGERCPMRA